MVTMQLKSCHNAHSFALTGLAESLPTTINEDTLQVELIQNPPVPYTQCILREWDVPNNESELPGRGDLVFQRPGFQEYLVVETKYLRTDTKGSRSSKRKKVKEQAVFYGQYFQTLLKKPWACVKAATYTNLEGLTMVDLPDSRLTVGELTDLFHSLTLNNDDDQKGSPF